VETGDEVPFAISEKTLVMDEAGASTSSKILTVLRVRGII